MVFFIRLFEILLPFLYFVTVWVYAKAFFSNLKSAGRLCTPLLFLTLLLHGLYIILRGMEFGHPPITSIFEICTLIAFSILCAYAVIELRTGIKTTGYFILMFAFFFQLASSLFIREVREVPAVLRNALLGIHVTSALLGYAAITLSAVYGLLYLMLYHDIKSNQFGVIYKRLPNLEVLERMSFTATIFGFVLLTGAIAVGYFWLPRALENFSYLDPKLLGTIAIWLLYAVGLIAKRIGGWQGKRIVVLSLFGFAIAMFSMTIINMFFSGFHKFY
jgi:ABC-type transport system involved in cytochrome c biogenesis permease subunit